MSELGSAIFLRVVGTIFAANIGGQSKAPILGGQIEGEHGRITRVGVSITYWETMLQRRYSRTHVS